MSTRKDDAGDQNQRARSNSASSTALEIPTTVFTVSIERVVRGTAPTGDLMVSQVGGKVTTPSFPGGPQITRTLQMEHDPALKPGERHLMFLRSAGDGTYYVVGGPQGRLAIDKTDKVHPVDPAAPSLRGREGQGVEGLIAEVASIH